MANKRTDEENVADVVSGGATDVVTKADPTAARQAAAGAMIPDPVLAGANVATGGRVMESTPMDVATAGTGRAVSSGDTSAIKNQAVGTALLGPEAGVINQATGGKVTQQLADSTASDVLTAGTGRAMLSGDTSAIKNQAVGTALLGPEFGVVNQATGGRALESVKSGVEQGAEFLYNKLAKEPTEWLFAKPEAPKLTKEEKQQGTSAYYTQGIAQPTMSADRTGAYANALPTIDPKLLEAARQGQFAAQAAQSAGMTPAQAQQWASQMQGANVAGAWQGVNMTPGLQFNTAVQQGQAAGMSPELLNQLMAASRGQGPSAAQAQLQAGTDQAIAAQQAQIAASRGAINPAVLRQQQQQLAQTTQQQAGQAAGLAAQEQQQAMQTAAQALAQQRGIESQEATTSMQVQAQIQQGNFQAAQDLVKQQVQQRFDSSRQQTDAINQALAQGQIDQGTADRLNAELKTRVAQTNAETIFKAAQGDQAAEMESQALKAQVIDNWVKSGLAYDQARLQADQFWAQFQQQARQSAAETSTARYAAKTGLAGKENGAMGAIGGIASVIGSIFYKGGVVQGYACGGVAKPRVNMAQGGTVEPVQAVASGGLAVHPAILEQQQMQQPAAIPMTGAPVPGDSPANDTVPAQLSPGEVVIPRSAVASGRSGILSFIDALDREGKLGDARQLASTPSYGEVLQAKQKIKNA